MSVVKTKFRLESTERSALFRQLSNRDLEQTGWGLKVKLAQADLVSARGDLTVIVSDPAQIKMFNDAEIGQEFEVTISPVRT